MPIQWPYRRRRGNAPRIAAAQPLDERMARAQKRLRQSWQKRADFFGRRLGATRFACGIKADSGARCTAVVEKLMDAKTDSWEPVDDDIATDLLHAYRGEHQSQAELIRQHIWLYDTVGEMVQYPNQVGGRARWNLRSPLAVEWRSRDMLVRDVEGGSERDGTAHVVPYELARRLWMPDATWPALATSAMQGVIDDCERYWKLAMRAGREIDSAMLMNGAVWIPTQAQRQLPREQVGPGGPGVARSSFEQDFYETAIRSVEDYDNLRVESLAPFLWSWDKEFGPPAKIDFARPLDPNGIAYRTEALEAIARGLDYPQRLLIDGGTGMNHWGSWLLEETFARSALAPILERVFWGDITTTFFRPGLRALAARGTWQGGDPDLYRVGFDMTPVIVNPNQSALAIELYQLGVVSDRTVLDVAGFDATSAPTTAELGRWIMRTEALRRPAGQDGLTGQAGPRGIPATNPADTARMLPAAAALPAVSRILVTTPVGPLPGEELGWLD